jgi:hypothetical protein
MSKFCINCGTELEDDAVFCTNCGANNAEAPAPAAAPAPEAPVSEAPVYEAPVSETPAYEAPAASNVGSTVEDLKNKAVDFSKPLIEKVKANPKLAMIGGGAVVGVILLIVLISSLIGGAWKSPVKTYLNGTCKGKISFNAVKKLAPAEYWEYMEEEQDLDMDDVEDYIKDDYKDEFEESLESDYFEDEYGTDIKISYKIDSKKKLSKGKLGDLRDALKENYDIAKKSVKAAYKVKVKITIKGDEDKDTNTNNLYVVKIGSKWYPVSENGSFLVSQFLG